MNNCLIFKKWAGRSAVLGLVILLLSACGASREGIDTSPSKAAWKNGVKGMWVLNAVEKQNFPSDYVVKTLFEEAPPECFIGSVWHLPSNGRGQITFESEGILCAPGAVRNIQWSIYTERGAGNSAHFQFKKIYPGDRAKNVLAGYRMELSYADENSMQMRMPIELGNSTGYLIFKFIR